MAKQVNPIRQERVKRALFEGKSGKRALIEAGYSPNTAVHACQEKVLKDSMQSILDDFRAQEVTVEYVLSILKHEADKGKSSSDRREAAVWLGKYLAMFTDKSEITNKNPEKIVISYISLPVVAKELKRLDSVTEIEARGLARSERSGEGRGETPTPPL